MTGDLLGTLRYMSPEQAMARRGYLDHRTDIYSLGATLYELLTLRPAVDGRDRQEILRKFAHDDPAPPRRLDPAIPRDLETIILTAIAKEPESRYGTAQELADDLRRFLDQKPIKAKPPSLWEYAVKWSRRHTAIVGAALAILAVAVVALLVNGILLGREQHKTAAALKLAEARSRQARKAVDSMYTRVAERWLVDQPGLRPIQREFLQEALAFYQEFARQQGEEIEARIEQAIALRRVGDIEDALSNHEQTERIYVQVIELLSGFADPSPNDPRRREELAAMHFKLAWLCNVDGQKSEAARQYASALEMYQALAARHPHRIEYRCKQARCWNGLGAASRGAGKLDEAEGLYRRALLIYESLPMQTEDSSELSVGIAMVSHNLGSLYQTTRRLSEAEHFRRKAIEFSAQALKTLPMSPKRKQFYATNLEGQAETLKAQGKWLEAEKPLREAIRILEPLAAELPETSQFREDLAMSLGKLGQVLHHRDQSAEAEDVLRRSIRISKEIINAVPKLIYRRVILAQALTTLAALERKKGNLDASNRLLADARSHVRIGLEINPRDTELNKLNVEIEPLAKGKDSRGDR